MFQVDLKLSSNEVMLENYGENRDYELANTTAVRTVTFYPFGPEPYIDVTFTMTFKQKAVGWSGWFD